MGSGTREVGLSPVTAATGSVGMVVRAVSLRPGESFRGSDMDSREMVGSVPVGGIAGGMLRCSTGARPVLPPRKTRACGLATMTRGGTPPPGMGTEAVGRLPPVGRGGGVGAAAVTGASGATGVALAGTKPVNGGAPVEKGAPASIPVLGRKPVLIGGAGGRGFSGVGRMRGSVLARDPVSEVDCFSCEATGETRPVGGRSGFCIGWVTAVEKLCEEVGLINPEPCIATVAAEAELGLGASCPDSALSGRGGSVTRRVSRLGLGSAEGGTSSAIMINFYRYFVRMFNGEVGNSDMRMAVVAKY